MATGLIDAPAVDEPQAPQKAKGLINAPALEEPPPPTKPKPGTIDPGVDVGFGPGVAPPDITPKTGQPVEAAKPQPAVKTTGLLTAPALNEPQKPTGLLTTAPALEEPQKPFAQPKLGTEGLPEPEEDPQKAAARVQKNADLEREKQAEISALGSPDTPEKLKAYEAKKQEIEGRYSIQQAQLAPPPPQAPGGVPTEEELAYRTPHLAAPYDINKPTQAAGGVPTPEELAIRTPHLAAGFTPEQMAEMTRQEEQRQLDEVRKITSRATPNLSAEQLGESYGASAAVVGAGHPAFPTQAEQQATDAAQVAQQQAEEDKKFAPPVAVTEQAIPTSIVPHKLTLNEQEQQEEFVKVDPQYNFKYSFADRVQALRNKFGNADELAASYAKLPPEAQKELGPLYNQAIEDTLQWNIDHPEQAALRAGVRGVVDTAKTAVGFVQGVLSLPGILPQLGAFGVTAAQALGVATAMAKGETLTPEQYGIIRTMKAAFQLGHHQTAQTFEDIVNAYLQVQNEGTGQKGAPDQTSWEQTGDMRGNERKRYIQGKMDSLALREQTNKRMAEGALSDSLRGTDPSLEDLARKGVHINPQAITGGATAVNFAELAPMFALNEALGVDGLVSKAVGKGTEVSGDIMKGLSGFHEKYIEPRLPGMARLAGEQAGKKLTKTIVTAATGGLGEHIPSFFYPGGKWNPLVRFGGFVGEKLGEVPGLIRENWWDPTSKLLIDHGQELQNPVANAGNTLALHGPAGALIRPVTAAAKGAVYALPFTAGPKTPEERGQILGAGAGLVAAHVAPEAARDASMASLFFRDPAKYKSMGFPSMHYGTDYFGKNFDAQHDTFVNSQPDIDQHRINDSRGLMPGIEQYHLGNQDYQDAVTHLQNNGYLPDGNLKSRGFNILRDPNTGQALILVNGDASGGFATAAHEIGHSIYRTLTPDQRDAFRNAAFQGNDPNTLTQWYFNNLTGQNVSYMSLPDEAGIANGTQGYLPGLNGYTKEHFVEEMGAETVAALLRGQPLSHFIRDPSLMRRAQFALGSVMEKMGIRMTPQEATTVLGVRPGVAQMWIMDKALRDYFKANPVAARPTPSAGAPGGGRPGPVPPGGGGGRQGPIPKPTGRQTAAVPKPTGGPAPVPPPPPPVGPKVTGGPKVTNNQPEIGGGPTGAPQKEINDAVKGLQGLKFPKRQAQQMVANASGQNAAELLRNALRNHQLAKGMIEVPRAPQEAAEAQAPTPAHPLAAHRELESPALLRRATEGDQEAVQALIERHGANWLQEFEKGGAHAGSQARAAEYRRKYPEQAAEQDQRIKAGVEAKPEPVQPAPQRAETDAERAYRQKYGTKAAPLDAPPHDVIAARAYELFQERGGAHGHEQEDWAQAERELRQRGIDAAKARMAGRAAFMPMAGEVALRYPEEEGGGRVFMSPLHGAKQFEIDDRDMTWTPAPKGASEKLMLDYNWGNTPDGRSKLGAVIDHPNLFKNYPDLRHVFVEMRPEMRGNGGYLAPGTGEPETILLRTMDKGVLAHEIQHAVQYRENWPPGSNPDRMVNELIQDDVVAKDLMAVFNAHYPELGPTEFRSQQHYFNYLADRGEQWDQWYKDRISRMASGAYLMSPGEIEARAVGKRAIQPSGWRMRPEEMLTQEKAQTEARVQEEFRRMAEPPISTDEAARRLGERMQASFMPEIQEGAITPDEFIQQRDRSARPGFLSPLAPEDLANHRLFTSPDGKVGVALSPDGDIQNVYNNSEPKIRGAGTAMVVHGIEQGGRTLDCFDGALPPIYRQAGFIETGRMKFNDAYAPPGWDYTQYDRPDVVFMGWGGYPEGGPEAVLARATSIDKSENIPNERSTRYYEGTDWDRAKEDSRAFARGAEPNRMAGARPGPEAYPAGAEPSAGPSEGLRGDLVEPERQPQIPGSKVSFMPDIPEAPKGARKKAVPIVRAPDDLRKILFTPEQRAWLADAQKKAIAAIDQYPETPLSGARYADGDEPFPETKMTKAQVAIFFDALNSNKLDFSNPEHQKLMADALTHDVLRRLISNPESLGWYNRVLDGAMAEMGKLEPRILQDPVHNLIMRLAMAITSQNQKVHPNFESAYRAYLYWDRTGEMPTDAKFFGGGTKAKAMIANFQKINELIENHKYDGTEEILKTPMSVREIRDKFKVKVPGEAMGYTSEASIMLGPKIGSFFNNLSKLYHTLTADLWFTRTMNRMAGRMLGFSKFALAGLEEPEAEGVEEEEPPKAGKERQTQLSRLRDLINSGELENSTAAQRKKMLKEIRAIEAFKSDPEALDRETAMALMPTIRDWAKAQHKIYADSTGYDENGNYLSTYGDKRPSSLAGKNIDLNFKELQDSPRNGTERENFRDIMKQVQANLASQGIDITHADNQAVLWYLEQDLFARAKGRKAGAFSADYLDAAYALRQKYEGKTPDEFGKVPEPEPPPSVPKTKRPKAAKAAAMPAGPDFPRAPPPLLPAMRVPPLVSQAEEEERKRQTGIPSAVTMPGQPEVRRGTMMMPRGQPPPPQVTPPSSQTPSEQQPPQRPSDFSSEPDLDIPSRNVTKGPPNRVVQQIILHHSSGHRTGDLAELTTGSKGSSAHYYVEQNGTIHHLVADNDIAHHVGVENLDPAHWGNAATIGIEMEHKEGEGESWSNAQVNAAAKIVAHIMQTHPNLSLDNVMGHSDVVSRSHRENEPEAFPWDKLYGLVRGYMGGRDIGQGIHAGQVGTPVVNMQPTLVKRAGGVQKAASDEAKQRAGLQSAARIMREEGSSGSQDGIPEIFGFRQGQDSEYEELARLRASGDEQGVQRRVVKGLIDRAVDAGSGQFTDPAVKSQIMSLAHMRGPGGARTILNAVGGNGHLTAEGSPSLDPEAVAAINHMPREEFMRRVNLARTIYDQKFHGQEYWNRFGKGLTDRYAREREFYGSIE